MRLARRTFTFAGIALATGAAAAAQLSNRRITVTETAYPPIGDFVETEGARLHYLQKGSGPDLVLSWRWWESARLYIWYDRPFGNALQSDCLRPPWVRLFRSPPQR